VSVAVRLRQGLDAAKPAPTGTHRAYRATDTGRLWLDGIDPVTGRPAWRVAGIDPALLATDMLAPGAMATLVVQGTAPAAPPAGFANLYLKSDGLYLRGSDGTETKVGATVTGWSVNYYNTIDLTGSIVLTRTEPTLGGSWGALSPVPGTVNADNWSLRATQTITVPVGADYVFTVRSDDGVRLYVDDVLQLDRWTTRPATTDSTRVALTAGSHVIKVEYFEGTGDAELSVSWSVYVAPIPGTDVDTFQSLINAVPSGTGGTVNHVVLPAGVYRPKGGANAFPLVMPRANVALDGLVTGGQRQSQIRGMDVWADWPRTGPTSTWVSGSGNSFGGQVPSFAPLTSDNIYVSPESRIPCLVCIDEVEQKMVPYSASVGPTPGQAMIDPTRRVILGSNPTGHLVEVAVVPTLLQVNASDVQVNNLVGRGGVPAYQNGLFRKRGRGIDRTTWDGNDLALSYHNLIESFAGDGDVIRNNILHDAGANAIEAGGEWGVRTAGPWTIQDNRIDRCNLRGFNGGWDVGAIKLVYAQDVNSARNVIQDCNCTAYWIDTNCWRIVWDHDVIRRCGNGFMYEVSSGPAEALFCTAEDIVQNGYLSWTACGLYVHDSAATRCGTGVRFQWQSGRVGEFTGSSCNFTGNREVNNTYTGNGTNVVNLKQ
jgi:hypothetical protein